MESLSRYVLCGMALVLSAAAGSSARTQVYAKVDAETAIYPGDEFVYSIVVEGGAKPTRIDLAPLAPLNPRRAGSGTAMQTVGGRTTVSYSENYLITAGQLGKMSVPAVTVVVDGQTYKTNPIEVTVSQPGTTEGLKVECTVSETRCYVGQPIVMTVTWIVTASVRDGTYNVGVPVFKSDGFFIEDVSESAAARTARRPMIDGVPVTVTEQRRLVKGVPATVISFRKVLIPKRSGPVAIEPVTVSTDVAVGRVRTRDYFNPYRIKYDRVSAQSDPVALDVLPLPETGRPPQFYGLVGRYTIAASAAPASVSVGDPITLTIRIGGSPYLKPVQWPELEQVPELAAGFKIPAERASPVIEGGNKVFTQTIRANRDSVTEVPPIPLVYFDPDRGDYVVARTEPIKLDVAPTKVLTNADLEGTDFTPANREVEAIRKGLSANYYGPQTLVNQSFSPLSAVASPPYAALWSIPLIGLVASIGARLATQTSPESLARKRRRQASGIALRRLKSVAPADPKDRHELLIDAMKGYIGDRFDKVGASCTADDCHRIVAESTGDAQVATRYRDLIAACEAARYSPMDAHIGTDQVTQAMELVRRVEAQSRK